MINIAKERINTIFTNCCRNVVEKSEADTNNIISFSKHLAKRNKKRGFRTLLKWWCLQSG